MRFFPITMSRWLHDTLRWVLAAGTLSLAAGCGGGGGGGGDPVAPPPPPPPAATAPVITTQPVSQTVVAGNSATFSVALQNSEGATFQWLRNGTAVASATQASHAIAVTASADDGSRWAVRVSNAGGNVTSGEALLTVTPRPVATPVGISVFTGDIRGAGNLNGSGAAARFNQPRSLVLDANDTAYVVETRHQSIRKVTSAGVASLLAGRGSPPTSVQDASSGPFQALGGMVFDRQRNALLVLDNQSIRLVTPDGQVSTLATTADYLAGSSASLAADGALFYSAGRTIASLTCCFQSAIYRVSPTGGTPTLVAGSPTDVAYMDGEKSVARLRQVSSMAADAAGNVFATDGTAVRKIGPDGAISTFAGTQTFGFADGAGNQARFGSLTKVILDGSGGLLVFDSGNKALRRISGEGAVTTVARDLPEISGMALDSAGALVFSAPHGVWKLALDGGTALVAGTAEPAADTAFGKGYGLVADSKGNVYTTILDRFSATATFAIGKYTPSGEHTSFGPSGDVNLPFGRLSSRGFGGLLAIDAADNLYEAAYVPDPAPSFSAAGTIYKVSPSGSVTVLVSTETGGPAFGAGALTANAAGTVFFGDDLTSALYKVSPAGQVTKIADMREALGVGAGQPWQNFGLAADNNGTVYITHTNARAVYRVDANGAVSLFAGSAPSSIFLPVSGITCDAFDGPGTSARFRSPTAPSVDGEGNLFLKDRELVRKITPQGMVSTVVGTPCMIGTKIGELPGALGDGPLEPFVLGERLTFGRDGILYVESDKALLKIRFR